jgi:hypothetical protein
MKRIIAVTGIVMLFAAHGFCAREVVYLGCAGEGAPGIEKTFNRLFEEYCATFPEIHLIDNDEVKRVQSRIGHFSYPAMTAPLAAILKRCAPDTALVIRGMVKSCSIRPVRRYFFDATIRGDLTIELTIYNLSRKSYAYIGDARATVTVDKGFLFWFGPIENAVQVSAVERSAILDKLQEGAVNDCGRILRAVLLNERSGKNRAPGSMNGIEIKNAGTAPSENDTAGLPDTTGFVEPDSTARAAATPAVSPHK